MDRPVNLPVKEPTEHNLAIIHSHLEVCGYHAPMFASGSTRSRPFFVGVLTLEVLEKTIRLREIFPGGLNLSGVSR